jgi:putative transposase
MEGVNIAPTNKGRRKKPIQGVITTKKIKIHLNDEQFKKIKQWTGCCRKTYNAALNAVKKGECEINKLRDTFVLSTSAYVKENPYLSDCPKEARELAIFNLIDALKESKKRVKTGVIKKFSMGFRTKKSYKQTLPIPISAFSKDKKKTPLHIWSSKLKEPLKVFRRSETIGDVGSFVGSNLVYTKIGKAWFHLTSDTKMNELDPENQGICSLDPGIRTFQTVYNPNGRIYKIGESDVSKIMRHCYHLDKLQSKYSKEKNVSKKRHYKHALCKARLRIRNSIDELHCKTIKFLINNFKTIIIPNTNLKNMTMKKKRVLSNKNARSLLTLSHYRFRERLLMKSKIMKNLEVIVIGEEFTSKTCGWCGCLNKIGSKKEWKCQNCKIHLDRDINGARNIFIKCMTEYPLNNDTLQAGAKQIM